MNVFAAALGTILADPSIGVAATWRAGDGSATRSVRIVWLTPDEVVDVLGGRVQAETRIVEAAVEDLPDLVEGDLFDVGAQTFRVSAPPRRDAPGLMWRAEVIPE